MLGLCSSAVMVLDFPRRPINSRYSRQNRLRIEQRCILRRFCRRLARRRFPLTEMLFTHDRFLSTVTVNRQTVNENCLVWHDDIRFSSLLLAPMHKLIIDAARQLEIGLDSRWLR